MDTPQIKIPNACVGLGIKFMSPYQMLRRERARFVLPAFSNPEMSLKEDSDSSAG